MPLHLRYAAAARALTLMLYYSLMMPCRCQIPDMPPHEYAATRYAIDDVIFDSHTDAATLRHIILRFTC